jgi:hypothetical protein
VWLCPDAIENTTCVVITVNNSCVVTNAISVCINVGLLMFRYRIMRTCEHPVTVEGLIHRLLEHIVDHWMHRGSMDRVESGIHRGPLHDVI